MHVYETNKAVALQRVCQACLSQDCANEIPQIN